MMVSLVLAKQTQDHSEEEEENSPTLVAVSRVLRHFIEWMTK